MLEFWPIVLTVSGLAISGLFGRAVRGHFVSEKLPPAMKALVALSSAAVLVYIYALWTGAAPLWQRAAGLALQLVAAGVFNWARTTTLTQRLAAAFDTVQPEFLMRAGPYRIVRHPFYFSYILFWFGSSLAGNFIVLWVICFALIVIYVVAARFEERKFMNSALADDYRRYSARTGFLFPKIAAFSKDDYCESRPQS
jgi:protein-S-isoprenylcysteine O-methyltransferase Ste14